MGRKSREKGAAGEREVAALLRPIFPDVRRRCSGEESQGDRGRDLDGVPGWAVQVQCAARPTPEKKLGEALAVAAPGERAVAITRTCSRSRSGQWLATLRLADFLDVFRLAARLALAEDARSTEAPVLEDSPPGRGER